MSGALPPGALARLAGVRVGLRADLEVVRNVGAGGKVQYVVHDPVRFTNSMFDPHEYQVLTAIDERRRLGDVFQGLVARRILEKDQQEEFFEFILMQHHRGMLRLPIADGQRTWERAKRRREQERAVDPLRRLMYWRIPVWSPDRFLEKTMPIVGWVFGRFGILLWLSLMVFAAFSAGEHFWPMITDAGSLLELDNLALLWGTLVVLKVFHEFGHAYSCKYFGGKVPEMGVALILTAPCAYVDASAAWKFANPWHRIWVSLGGMYAESFLAAVALIVWAGTDDALIKAVTQNVVVLATAVTVLFNINPLMRFDGYYLLSDLMREPNLRARSTGELMRVGRKLLGLETPPPSDRQRLHLTFGIGAFFYKLILATGIVSLVVLGWPLVGAVLGIAFGWMLLGQPVLTCVRWLWNSDDTINMRRKARGVAVGLVTVVPALLALLVPVGFQVQVPGLVVARGGEQVVRAPFSGFVRALPVEVGEEVRAGQMVARIESPDIQRELWQARGERDAAKAERRAAEGVDAAAAESAARREQVQNRLVGDKVDQMAAGTLTAARFGRVVSWVRPDLLGAWVQEGEPILTLAGHERQVEAWIPARRLKRSRVGTADLADVRSIRHPDLEIPATVVAIDPQADREDIPELLTARGVGAVRMQNRGERPQADRAYVRMLLDLEGAPPEPSLGSTVQVRFGGRIESLGSWLSREGLAFVQQWRLSGTR